jgi:hypothetical protein
MPWRLQENSAEGRETGAGGASKDNPALQRWIRRKHSARRGKNNRNARSLQLPSQRLHHSANRLLIPPVPAPLPFPVRLDQPGLRQYRHVMRNRRLRERYAFLNVTRTQAHSLGSSRRRRFGLRFALLKSLKNSTPGRVGNGTQRTIESSFAGKHRHSLEIARKSMSVNLNLPALNCGVLRARG